MKILIDMNLSVAALEVNACERGRRGSSLVGGW